MAIELTDAERIYRQTIISLQDEAMELALIKRAAVALMLTIDQCQGVAPVIRTANESLRQALAKHAKSTA